MDVKDSVYEKMKNGLAERIEVIKLSPIDEIIGRAHELSIKMEIIELVANDEVDIESLKILDEFAYPLTRVYEGWLLNDYSITDKLIDTIDETAQMYEELIYGREW